MIPRYIYTGHAPYFLKWLVTGCLFGAVLRVIELLASL